jgi:hypothetical protein
MLSGRKRALKIRYIHVNSWHLHLPWKRHAQQTTEQEAGARSRCANFLSGLIKKIEQMSKAAGDERVSKKKIQELSQRTGMGDRLEDEIQMLYRRHLLSFGARSFKLLNPGASAE